MALIDMHPLLLPALLSCGAAGAACIAYRRRAAARSGSQRTLVAAYLLLALVAGAQSGWLLYDRGPRFWSARWDESTQSLRLDRAFPIPDIKLELAQVEQVTEMLAPTHTIAGLRPAAEYEVKTKDGSSFWSGPIFTERERRLLLAELQPVCSGRLVRFLVGKSRLP